MSFEIKTYKDSYLYNNKITKANQAGGSKNNAVLKDFIMNAHRVEDKQAESFRGILEDVKRQQMSSVLYTVLLLDNVQICINKSELPRAFKVFEAKDVLNGKKSTVFIDCTGLIEYKNGYYYCRKVDVFVTYLLEALIYILYRNANMKIMNNSNVTINATECYVSMFNFVLDYLRIIGYSENKNKISYLVALFFLTNMMSKPLDNYARSVAAAISGIDKKNIEAAKKDGYELIAKLNSIITQGNRTKEDEFEFNKDAGMYQCKAGHLAIHKYLDKRKKEKKNKNPRMVYSFDIEKCKCCPYRDGCYKEGAKKKTYTETIISDSHSEQAKFQETEHFKEKMKERYKIEAKNSELKHRHGYDTASSSGLICMEMQGAMTIFAVNLKRIVKLINEK